MILGQIPSDLHATQAHRGHYYVFKGHNSGYTKVKGAPIYMMIMNMYTYNVQGFKILGQTLLVLSYMQHKIWDGMTERWTDRYKSNGDGGTTIGNI